MTDTTNGTTSSSEELAAALTLEEKAALTSGEGFWHTTPVERLGLPSIVLTDGPHGVRKQAGTGDHLGLGDSVPATCFPPAVAMGSSFDPELLERVGRALGAEARAAGVHVLLGPGLNIKRSPLCGRNFEYLSEDPIVSGVLASALVRGLQSQGVGASPKHFAANNQEHDRMRVSADIDERPLREIYLRGFERVVTEQQPWTVMCSYNRVNGVHAAENSWLLDTVLRREWGFDGLVVSDWGAVNERAAALSAGLDLEMPAGGAESDQRIVTAVRSGELDETTLDTAASRVAGLVERTTRPQSHHPSETDPRTHHELAREVAARSVVLLKNADDVLPLSAETSVSVIGEFARTPRYQGGGSSLINPTALDSALEALRTRAGAEQVTFAAGFTFDEAGTDQESLRRQAVEAAAAAEVALVFLGLPDSAESEGYDRADLRLPATQLELLDAVLDVNPRTVVVLSNGGVVDPAPFVDRVPALVEGWLLGQAGGGALADVLYGDVNPSGRLTETVPMRLADTPAYLDFPGEHGHVRYGEGLFVGYRWYDARDFAVRFPFGHGLSYTSFAYSDLSLRAHEAGTTVRATITNTGQRAGREVVQVYTGVPDSAVTRPPRELKGFACVELQPGQQREVTIELPRHDLAHWDTRFGSWVVEGGEHTVEVGSSSRDIRLKGTVEVAGDETRAPLTLQSSLGELLRDPQARQVLQRMVEQASGAEVLSTALNDPGLVSMMESFPLDRLPTFLGEEFSRERIAEMLEVVNAQRP
ncbi:MULTISPECIES: glycoside hydrolase family 3 C-terminal domain-containing protein [unclassified Actinopolyspora]|uniref:glycoside hydrolase family 3 C-terminal domain-containing protein n=1 Tax=Actinopolyspora TaxID=1849 RepID=UPI0013F65938|nr:MULTISPECIES: glycoside hydrolase family 3 C-terminal domain-containing protein [unclassified Actinopolyspora]NHD15628.1 beta-glucosidase [Actinopolyspora sp. BKK2]NHE75159.1 beta-glucosidase [Actinopolyspora sp. BKK1]